jgi:hypothetical protein
MLHLPLSQPTQHCTLYQQKGAQNKNVRRQIVDTKIHRLKGPSVCVKIAVWWGSKIGMGRNEEPNAERNSRNAGLYHSQPYEFALESLHVLGGLTILPTAPVSTSMLNPLHPESLELRTNSRGTTVRHRLVKTNYHCKW